jgi:Baseplate J-like protein
VSGPYPLVTLAPTITAAGISVPDYADILASLQASYRLIYGQDVDLSDDTQDGQWIAIQAQAIYDLNDVIVSVYQGYSPTYAQGVQLSSQVKINGLQRESPGQSTAPCLIVGVQGTLITSGILVDQFNNQWTLPPNTLIPSSGDITVTITCQTFGAITLASGSTTVGNNGGLAFVTIVQGWQTATTTANASLGAPLEDDAELRQRQSISTGISATTPLQSILAAVANLPLVSGYAIYENDLGTPDSNGIPGHEMSLVVEGGVSTQIAQTVAFKKTIGAGTYATGAGSVSVGVIDPSGVPLTINYYVLATLQIYFAITINPLAGYVSGTGTLILNAVAAAITALPIGSNVQYIKLYSAANLSGTAALSVGGGATQAQLDQLSDTFEITQFFIGTSPGPTGTTDIPITFIQEAVSSATNGTLAT